MEETVISKGVKLEGPISSQTNLIIFGTTEGKINAKQSVVIKEGANVTGDIIAKTLIVKGIFRGNADCHTVKIQKGGLFEGNITSHILEVASKGYFEGKNTPKKKENTPAKDEKKLLKDLNTENILL